jgi:hypothetical protein
MELGKKISDSRYLGKLYNKPHQGLYSSALEWLILPFCFSTCVPRELQTTACIIGFFLLGGGGRANVLKHHHLVGSGGTGMSPRKKKKDFKDLWRVHFRPILTIYFCWFEATLSSHRRINHKLKNRYFISIQKSHRLTVQLFSYLHTFA